LAKILIIPKKLDMLNIKNANNIIAILLQLLLGENGRWNGVGERKPTNRKRTVFRKQPIYSIII
jgi:hypothetical protein